MLPLACAIRKHGEDKMKVQTLIETENSLLAMMEIKCIKALRPEYNRTLGGEGVLGHKRSKETRRNQAAAMKDVWQRDGYREETARKISNSKKGKPLTDAHRKALSDTAKIRWSRGVPDEYREACLLYTSPSPRDQRGSRMPSSA